MDYRLESPLHWQSTLQEEKKMIRSIVSKNGLVLIAVIVALAASATSALAQVEQPQQITVQGTALITKSTTDQTPSNDVSKSGGFLVGYSYQFSRWFGAEGNYGYSRNTQNFLTLGGPSSLQADFHEVTGALVVHFPVNVRRSEEHTSELQSRVDLVCRLLLEKKNK